MRRRYACWVPCCQSKEVYRFQMIKKKFTLHARISTDNRKAIKPILEELVPKESITSTDEGFLVEAAMFGESAREAEQVAALRIASCRAQDPTAFRMDFRWYHGTFLRLCTEGFEQRLMENARTMKLSSQLESLIHQPAPLR